MPQDPGASDELAKQGKLAFDYGLFWFKGQHIGSGQAPVKKYNRQLRDLVASGNAGPSFIVSHELPLDQARRRRTSISTTVTRAGPRSSSTRRAQERDMATTLNGRRVAILAADGVERVELERPRQALEDAGARTDVVSITSGEIKARDHDLEDAGTFAVDQLVGAVSVDDYEALLLPGGTVNPDKLRMEPAAVKFVRDFVRSGKPVASMCHGPWNFVEADVARGRRLSSWPSVRTDLRNAWAEVVDEEVVTDGNITTSRSPDDLPAFCERIVQEFAGAPQSAGAGGRA